MTVELPLTNSPRKVLIDEQDYENLSAHNWYLENPRKGLFYARVFHTFMHRMILRPPKGMQIHHRDGDGLNNQRKNLVICTPQENSFFRRSRQSASGVAGVAKIRNYWYASITLDGTRRGLGCFKDFNDAVAARLKAEQEHFWEPK